MRPMACIDAATACLLWTILKQKSPTNQVGLLPANGLILLSRNHRNGALVKCATNSERNCTINQREQRVIFADADVNARMELSATLTNDDRTCWDRFAAVLLNTESFRF